MSNPYAGDMAQVVLHLLSASSLLYYVLPFALCSKLATPMANMHKTFLKHNLIITPSYMILLPIFCFVLVVVGQLMMTLGFLEFNKKLFSDPSSLIFFNIVMFGNGFTSSLGLNFFLVVYEFFFYQICSFFKIFTKYVLASKETSKVFNLANDLVYILSNFQAAFGWFLLVDLALLLLFCLCQWYMAFINIQVSTLTVAGPTLVILAEMLRVFGISSACENITNMVLEVAMKLEELKTGIVDHCQSPSINALTQNIYNVSSFM